MALKLSMHFAVEIDTVDI